MLTTISDGIGPLMEKVGNTLDSLNVTVAGVNRLLSQENQESIERTLAHLERTMSDLRHVAKTIDGRSAELDSFILNLAKLSESFNGIAAKVDTTLTGVNSVVGKIDESDIEGVISSFKSLLENMNDPEGTLGRLLVDDSVYDSVDSLLKDVDDLVQKIKDNPKKYIKISIF